MKTVTNFNERFDNLNFYLAGILILIILLSGCSPIEVREDCISQEFSFEGVGAFYELIDLTGKEVWGTPDFSPEEYAEFSPPFLWQKNQPRTNMSEMLNAGNFLKSPGCSELGQYTYMQAFDKEFLNVVKLVSMEKPLDDDGLIRETVLEKYHQLTFASGTTVYILEDSDSKQFIGVSRDVNRTSDTFTLPEGWSLLEYVLTEDLQIELSGTVSVLRTDNEDSFQGPLPEDLVVITK
jgi:hypothetical protein